MKYAIAALFFLGACQSSATRSGPVPALTYEIIGGKSGAPVERLKIDCTSNLLTLSRESQGQQSLYRHQADIDSGACRQLARQATPLCRDERDRQEGAFDTARYRLRCQQTETETVEFAWQGTLSAAPSGLDDWHQQTRNLLKKHFPEIQVYP